MRRESLTLEELQTVMDRLDKGERLTNIADEYGVERSALYHRLKRRFKDKYNPPIGRAAKGHALEEDLVNILNEESILHYLNNPRCSYHRIHALFGITPSTTMRRIRKLQDHSDIVAALYAKGDERLPKLEHPDRLFKKQT